MTLHTAYRPAKFSEVVGQKVVVKALQEALRTNMSRAFLLIGPSGVGKTTLARIAAAVAGCTTKDILEIDAATYTGVESMRTITNAAQYSPLHGKMKATIIDEAHALSSQAWKAMLKTLEEPPPFMFWFLCTTELSKVPETIRTRCIKLTLQLVGQDDLFELVKGIAADEKLAAAKSEAVLELCCKEAGGSPRQAIVNLAACGHTTDRKEAAELLRSAIDDPKAFDLARLLIDNASWLRVQKTLAEMGGMNPESIRHVVRDYVSKVVLSAKNEKTAGRALEILDAFSVPCNSGDGISPILLACGRVLLQ